MSRLLPTSLLPLLVLAACGPDGDKDPVAGGTGSNANSDAKTAAKVTAEAKPECDRAKSYVDFGSGACSATVTLATWPCTRDGVEKRLLETKDPENVGKDLASLDALIREGNSLRQCGTRPDGAVHVSLNASARGNGSATRITELVFKPEPKPRVRFSLGRRAPLGAGDCQSRDLELDARKIEDDRAMPRKSAGSDIPIDVRGSPGVETFLDKECSLPSNRFAIVKGQAMVRVYYRLPSPGVGELQASGEGLEPIESERVHALAPQSSSVASGDAKSDPFAWTVQPLVRFAQLLRPTAQVGTCAGHAIEYAERRSRGDLSDTFGGTATVAYRIAVTSTPKVAIFADEACTKHAGTFEMRAGDTFVTFYVKALESGESTISLSVPGLPDVPSLPFKAVDALKPIMAPVPMPTPPVLAPVGTSPTPFVRGTPPTPVPVGTTPTPFIGGTPPTPVPVGTPPTPFIGGTPPTP